MNRKAGDLEIPATKIELSHGVNPGLWQQSLAPGLVPIYEEHLIRLERRISLENWASMDVDEKAMMVALHRTHVAMSNLQNEAEIEAAKRK